MHFGYLRHENEPIDKQLTDTWKLFQKKLADAADFVAQQTLIIKERLRDTFEVTDHLAHFFRMNLSSLEILSTSWNLVQSIDQWPIHRSRTGSNGHGQTAEKSHSPSSSSSFSLLILIIDRTVWSTWPWRNSWDNTLSGASLWRRTVPIRTKEKKSIRMTWRTSRNGQRKSNWEKISGNTWRSPPVRSKNGETPWWTK